MAREYTDRQFVKAFKDGEFERLDRLDRAIIDAAHKGRRVLRSVIPEDTGVLWKSVTIEVGTRPNVAALVQNAPYAAAVEVGTRPFTPPLDAIIAWATRQAPNLGLSEDEAHRLAGAVWQSIRKNGLKGHFHTKKVIPRLVRLMAYGLAKAVRKEGPF